jgi:hypothetical protein
MLSLYTSGYGLQACLSMIDGQKPGNDLLAPMKISLEKESQCMIDQ